MHPKQSSSLNTTHLPRASVPKTPTGQTAAHSPTPLHLETFTTLVAYT